MSVVENSNNRLQRRSSNVSRRTSSIMESEVDINDEELELYKTPMRMFFHQVHAMAFRRWIKVKRTIGSVLINMLVTLIVSCLTIVVQFMLNSMISDSFTDYTFETFAHESSQIFVIADDYDNKWWQRRYVDAIKYVYKHDTGKDCDVKVFSNVEQANKYTLDVNNNNVPGVEYTALGFILPTEFSKVGGNKITVIWNDTAGISVEDMSTTNESMLDYALTHRIEMAMLTMPPDDSDPLFDGLDSTQKAKFNEILKKNKFDKPSILTFIDAEIASSNSNTMFAIMAPMLIAAGIISISSTIIPGPITDIQGPIRSYMESCSLKLLPYWVVSFIFDLVIYEIDVFLIWALFCICQIESFTENLGMTYYLLFISGPSLVLFLYVMSFMFDKPDSAARNAFLINIVILMIPIIVMLVGVDLDDAANSMNDLKPFYWIYSLIPPTMLEGFMQAVFMEYQYNKDGIPHYFSNDSSAQPYAIFSLIDIIIYAVVLAIIERYRKKLQRHSAQSNFGDYTSFFQAQKDKHPVTSESEEMAKEVKKCHDYAVRIDNVSRLFFNTEGKPIPAVNCVSLGVKKGSIFGFLGANGAGKTTLINMITSILPTSAGKIEIMGKDIATENDPSLLAVCPQFNTHLCDDMTISEHLHLYSLLHCLPKEQEAINTRRLISLLDLNSFKDIPIKQLSEGDVRKLSIALSFLGRASIILLDEPTATLDPVSMSQVHEMMLFYKGKKTFMLCTHLLSEAEALCDMISIMIKGNVYTCGSPQYLSSKFGTDYKVDLMLSDSSEETGEKVDKFFSENLPQAVLNIKRPTARIYNILASSIEMDKLFRIMEDGKGVENGFTYYTCSSSSLEKVFMEIVRMSEGGEEL